ncbi:MAG: FkbM family methyltransferase [Proteobacteria bacterium]|nr:FkbM family methyltransferase [Pseudomonadota bacterium]
MPSDAIPAIFAKTATTYLEAKPHGFEFAFPNAANMASLVNRILRGAEYALPDLPGYAPRLIVDIGANVGAAAVSFALRYPDAEIHCYEPSRHNMAFLARNVATLPHIRSHAYGLSDREQEVDLHLGFGQSMQCSVIPSRETGAATERVTLRRARPELERIGLAAGGALIKLDTEGCELPILTDIAPLLGAVDLLYVEYHSEADRRAIERQLGERFLLATARAHHPHRGLNLYVAQALVAAYPVLDELRLPPSGPAAP